MSDSEVFQLIPRRSARGSALPVDLAITDAFLLSQVDGVCTVDELCDLTPRPRGEVVARLIHLEQMGLVELGAKSETVRKPSSARTGRPSACGEVASTRYSIQGAQPAEVCSRPAGAPNASSPVLGASLRAQREAFAHWRTRPSTPEAVPPPTSMTPATRPRR